MARLRSRSPQIALGWLTMVEALGATGLMTYFWPRLVEIATNDLCHQTNPRPCTAADFERLFLQAL